MNNGIVNTERLSRERRVRYLHCMSPRNETVSLVQKCLRNKVFLRPVKGDGCAAVDLNRVGTIPRSNRPIYLHGGTYLIVRVDIGESRVSITLKPTVGQLTGEPMRRTPTSNV